MHSIIYCASFLQLLYFHRFCESRKISCIIITDIKSIFFYGGRYYVRKQLFQRYFWRWDHRTNSCGKQYKNRCFKRNVYDRSEWRGNDDLFFRLWQNGWRSVELSEPVMSKLDRRWAVARRHFSAIIFCQTPTSLYAYFSSCPNILYKKGKDKQLCTLSSTPIRNSTSRRQPRQKQPPQGLYILSLHNI